MAIIYTSLDQKLDAEARALWATDDTADYEPHTAEPTRAEVARIKLDARASQAIRVMCVITVDARFPALTRHVRAIHRRAVYLPAERTIVRMYEAKLKQVAQHGPLVRVRISKEQAA